MKMGRFLLMAVLALSSSLTVMAQNDLKVMADKLNEGIKFYNEKKYPQAVTSLKKTLDLIKVSDKADEPAVVDMSKQAKSIIANAHRDEGRALATAKDYDKALVAFQTAIKAYDQVPNSVGEKSKCEDLILACYSVPATTKAKAKDYAGAIAILDKGIASNKNGIRLYIMKAQAFENQQKHKEAIDTYKQAISIAEGSNRYRRDVPKYKDMMIKGQLKAASELSKAKKYTQAMECIDRALVLSPKNPNAELLKVQTYNVSNNFDAVIKSAPAAIAVQTSSDVKSQLYFVLASSYVKAKDLDKAKENYKKVTTGPFAAQAKEQVKQIESGAKVE